MGPDFYFMGEEYIIQVGNKDFRIDLLMHHSGLNSLVALELKVTEFLPEYLGKMHEITNLLNINLMDIE